MKEINAVLERKVREEVMKLLDQRENEYLPQVILDTMEVSLASAHPEHTMCMCISKTLSSDFLFTSRDSIGTLGGLHGALSRFYAHWFFLFIYS